MARWTNWKDWKPFGFLRGEEEKRETVPVQQSRSERGETARSTSSSPSRWQEEGYRDPFGAFDPFGSRGLLERWFGDYRPIEFRPNVDVVDEGDKLRVAAELPGLSKDDLDIELKEGNLIIRGEKRNEEETREENCYRLERSYGSFQRVVPLPEGLDLEHPDASFDGGVLSIRFPKTEGIEEESPRRVPIG